MSYNFFSDQSDRTLTVRAKQRLDIKALMNEFWAEIETSPKTKNSYYTLFRYLKNRIEHLYVNGYAENVNQALKDKFLNIIIDRNAILTIANNEHISPNEATIKYVDHHPFFTKLEHELPDLSEFKDMPEINDVIKAMHDLRKFYIEHIKDKAIAEEQTVVPVVPVTPRPGFCCSIM